MTETDDTLSLLESTHLFKDLSHEEILLIADNGTSYEYAAGETIFNEGEVGSQLFIIKQGEVRVIAGGKDVARYVRGELVGELDLFHEAPRNATAVAETDSVLFAFPRRGLSFGELVEEHPRIFARVLRTFIAVVAGRIRSTNRIISENAPWVQELRRQVLGDTLTGLFNKAWFDEEFGSWLSDPHRRVAVIMLKPDNFKDINDTYGHEAGDQTLQLMARTISETAPPDAVAMRYRGNQFAVVVEAEEDVIAQARKLQQALIDIDLSGNIGESSLELSVSVGISVFPDTARAGNDLVNAAHEKVFEARADGGNRIYLAEHT